MFGFNNWRQVQTAYRNNIEAVRTVFDGFYSPGLISRMCVELNTTGQFNDCETRAQTAALTAALSGSSARYIPENDPELAELFEES